MKHFLSIFVGAIALLSIGIAIVIGPLAHWIDSSIHGDDDINSIVGILLFGVYPGLLIIGGLLGSALFRRARSRKL